MSRDADASVVEMEDAKRGAAAESSSAWGDLGVTVALLVAWLALTRWVLPASCADGACGAPALEELQPPASAAGRIAPETSHGDLSR